MGKSKELWERLREAGCYAEDMMPSDIDRDYWEAANNRLVEF